MRIAPRTAIVLALLTTLVTAVASADSPEPAGPVTACHPSLNIPDAAACPDFVGTQTAAGFSSCMPHECQIRVYKVVGTPTIQTSDAPPCCPRCTIRDANGDCSQDCGRCAGLDVVVPAGGVFTRYRVAAADTTHGPAGEGYCGDNVTCPALPFSSFGSYYQMAQPDGSTMVSVLFKNWRHDKGRRGALAVWFTPPPSRGAIYSSSRSTVHIVETGDTLEAIAVKYLGHRDWSVIFRSNRAIIASPDLIVPGQKLVIPVN